MHHPRRLAPIALVSLITFLVILVSWLASPHAHSRYSIAIALQAPNGGQSRFFFDTGHNFNEAEVDDLTIQHTSETKTYRYIVPSANITAIRFDFPPGSGEYHIHKVTLLDDSNTPIQEIPPQSFIPNNDVASITPTSDGIAVTIAPGKLNPYIVESLAPPITVPNSTHRFISLGVVIALAAAALAGLFTAFLMRAGHAARLQSLLARVAARFSIPNFLPLDHLAVAFYFTIFLYFLILSAAGLHGSSSSIQSLNFQQDHPDITLPLLGQPRGIRVDEWNTHTPAILNQLARPDTLSPTDGIVGPFNATLIGCLPAKHWSALFHPEFWSFFILPRDTAFAVYWQFKTLLLLTGVFTLLLMLTRSTGLAIFGALWFYYSPYTQWCFSWPTLLPDMIGNCCLATVFACHTLIARSWKSSLLSALTAAYFGLGFVLLTYPPFQIPFVWIGVAILAGFIWTRWSDIFTAPGLARRLTFFVAMLALILLITAAFLFDIHAVYNIATNTIYPGKRSVPGGLPYARLELLSAFFDLAKREDHLPAELINICEGSGYYWLAPITLLLLGGMSTGLGFAKKMFFTLWLPFLALVAWLLFPFAPSKGHFLLLDMVPPNRVLPAIGLLNIILVLLLLRFRAPPARPALSTNTLKKLATLLATAAIALGVLVFYHVKLTKIAPPSLVSVAQFITLLAALALLLWQAKSLLQSGSSALSSEARHWLLPQLGLALGTFAISFALLYNVNAELKNFLTLPAVTGSAFLLTCMIGCLINRLTKLLMAIILIPLFINFAYINPIDRGFAWLDHSDLHALLQSSPPKPGKWLVYSDDWLPAPSFVAAEGLDVFNYFHYIPDLPAMAKFDPTGTYKDAYNQSGYIETFTPALGTPPGSPSTFQVIGGGLLQWHVSPTDPGIAANNIRYLAFYGKPDPALLPPNLFTPLADHPFDGFWIYERK